MNKDKEWKVEATIEIRTSFFCDTKEEAEKEAHKYLEELCTGLYPDCCSNSYEIENIYSYTEDEPQESDHKCHSCKHYTSGEHDGSCGSYICKEYSNWESEDKE